MRGMDANTGKPLTGDAHLAQSVLDILTTPVGSRVMRRDYGSRLFELIDAPQNAQLQIDVVAETVDALAKWEPRIRVDKVEVRFPTPGHTAVTVTGVKLPGGEPIALENLEVL